MISQISSVIVTMAVKCFGISIICISTSQRCRKSEHCYLLRD